ncbi:hypothetical protein [Solicola gregarius]|uniref:Alanine-rich protein n=1 Tax=Solicola gregarius TaxID=2908642 RepID=A0AA46TJG7_9ACTN|nr:hypothetical protein [Solicola gregarius]UYM06230.1 hypothetical protein L0C25_03895 [Solicola gregarius]
MRDPPRPAVVTMRAVGYAYPWDVLGDPAFIDRVRRLGLTRVAIASAYHTTRAATPFHPRHTLVSARTAALYRPVRAQAWRGRRLAPVNADWVDDPDPFGHAAEALTTAGLEVAAWIVLTHATRLGEQCPDIAVVNCFGERYPYALCPQSAEVREYAATLAAEAVRDVDCSAVVLEACGQLGVEHGGHHEKTAGAYAPSILRLLSICCCTACREAWRIRGLDPEPVVQQVRGAVDSARSGAPSPDLTETLDVVLSVRQWATDTLRRSVIDAVRAAVARPVEVVLHAQPDPWATGALPGLTSSAPDDVDTVVAQCWATGSESTDSMRSLVETLDGRAAAGAYVTVLPPVGVDDFGPHLRALRDAGTDDLHLYHLGLAGPDRYPLLAEAVVHASTEARV